MKHFLFNILLYKNVLKLCYLALISYILKILFIKNLLNQENMVYLMLNYKDKY